MRWRSAWLTACSVLLAAGCAGGKKDRLPAETARRLGALAKSVAAELTAGRPCPAGERARRLQSAMIEAINRGEVPSGLEEELQGLANELAARIPCPGKATRRAEALAYRLAALVREAARP